MTETITRETFQPYIKRFMHTSNVLDALWGNVIQAEKMGRIYYRENSSWKELGLDLLAIRQPIDGIIGKVYIQNINALEKAIKKNHPDCNIKFKETFNELNITITIDNQSFNYFVSEDGDE